MSANIERAMLDEAHLSSIPVRLGDELIDAARELVAACYTRNQRPERFAAAIKTVRALVGSADHPIGKAR